MNAVYAASELSRSLDVYTDCQNYTTANEYIETKYFNFGVTIELEHDYYPGDRSTGESYDFDITKVSVTLNEVEDEDGEVALTTREIRSIEKSLEQNLSFNIFKKYL